MWCSVVFDCEIASDEGKGVCIENDAGGEGSGGQAFECIEVMGSVVWSGCSLYKICLPHEFANSEAW